MKSRYRWVVAAVMFLFLLLHQADKLLIGPLTTAIMEDFQIIENLRQTMQRRVEEIAQSGT